MIRSTRSLAVLLLAGFGLVGCDGGGIKEGTAPEAQGNVLPPGFESLQKKQDAGISKTGKVVPAKPAEKEATPVKTETPAPPK